MSVMAKDISTQIYIEKSKSKWIKDMFALNVRCVRFHPINLIEEKHSFCYRND